jgi:tripartite-type tricarboxylate transporter receptor subunit TctC
MSSRLKAGPAIVAVCLSSVGTKVPASAQEGGGFYKNKTVNLVIGYEPGGGYDLYGRLVARYLGKYIPGHPDIVPQNMPGAGGIRAANFMYNAAARDGTELGLVTQTVALEKMLESPNVQYDADKFQWIGRIEPDDDVLITWKTSKIASIDDAFKYRAVIPSPSTGIFMPPVLGSGLITNS